jgi:hypothetical protein
MGLCVALTRRTLPTPHYRKASDPVHRDPPHLLPTVPHEISVTLCHSL